MMTKDKVTCNRVRFTIDDLKNIAGIEGYVEWRYCRDPRSYGWVIELSEILDKSFAPEDTASDAICEEEVTLQKGNTVCDVCNGTGNYDNEPDAICEPCEGRGLV